MSQRIFDVNVSREQIQFIGKELNRPECVLAARTGELWISDRRGIVSIDSNGRQRLTERPGEGSSEPSEPNGLARLPDGTIYVANRGLRRLERIAPEGHWSSVIEAAGSERLGEVNFVLADPRGGLWLTVSTRQNDWLACLNGGVRDGYIVRIDERGTRIVADGLAFTNECRLDAARQYLYVVESFGRCISRFPVGVDGDLGPREPFGPSDLEGIPDGMAFDSLGNLWVTIVGLERIVAITPQGSTHVVLDVGTIEAFPALRAAILSSTVTFEHFQRCAWPQAPVITSLAFGGPDMCTVYLGSLGGTSLPWFRSPIAGLPMVHS
jgi:gluconolactonase